MDGQAAPPTGAPLATPLVRVLGPVLLAGAAGEVPPPGALPTRLVVALALAGRAGLSVEGLSDEVWREGPPRNPRGALQMLVSRIRSAAVEGVLRSTTTGYALATTDLATAEATAAATAPEGSAVEVLERATAALGLWRGPAGEGVDDDLANELRDRADRAEARLLLARGRARLTLHEAPAAAADAERLTTLRPLDSGAVQLRMEALHASGRTADALAAFVEHRERLADELGSDPDPTLVTLNTRLLRPMEHETVGLRASATPLLGRDGDAAAVTELVRSGRLTTIAGTGGLGKTTLAQAVAARMVDRFERVVLVELAGVGTGADLWPAVGTAVGARPVRAGRRITDAPQGDVTDRVREVLRSRRTLLVLDNCEHLVDAVAGLAADLLAAVPSLSVLTTSRVPLLLPGERVHPLPALSPATDAAQLFRDRALAARPDAVLDAAAVTRICARLDGLPLAIELAAARLRIMTLAELEARLGDRFAVLVGGSRVAPARHRTLFAVIDWSRRLLDAAGQEALALLAVFPDGFTAASATALLGHDAEPVLQELADQSLVLVREAGGASRFRMLETVREFGLLTLAEAGRTAEAEERLDAWAVRLCRSVGDGLLGGADPAAGAALVAEEETLVGALRRPVVGRDHVVLAVFGALGTWWAFRGELTELTGHVDAVLAAARRRPADGVRTLDALRALLPATTAAAFGQSQRAALALALLRRVLRLVDPADGGFWPVYGRFLLQAGSGRRTEGALDDAVASPDPLVACFAQLVLGQIAENEGRSEEALAAHRRARATARREGLPWFQVAAEMSMADVHSQRGEHATAHAIAVPLRAEIVAVDRRVDVRQLDWVIAVSELALGQADAARAGFEALADGADDRLLEADDTRSIALTGLARVAEEAGDADEADRLWREALAVSRRSSMPWRLLVQTAAVAALLERADRAADTTALARSADRLRLRLRAAARLQGRELDVPVLATGLLVVGAVVARLARTAQDRDLGARLAAGGLAIGARLDFSGRAALRAAAPADVAAARERPRPEVLVECVVRLHEAAGSSAFAALR